MSSAACERYRSSSPMPSGLHGANGRAPGPGRVDQLLDESIAAREYLIPESEAKALFDLGAVDWDGVQEAFKQGRQRTAAQRLRSLLFGSHIGARASEPHAG